MTDISKCNNEQCPLSSNCWRFVAPNGFLQAYTRFEPVIGDNHTTCSFHLPVHLTAEEKQKEMVETGIELKTNNRFTVLFPEDFHIDPWTIIAVNKPKYNGSGCWSDMEIRFIDPVKHKTSEGLFKLVSFLETNKQTDQDVLFDFTILILNAVGEKIEEWLIPVKEVVMIDFGDLNRDDDKRTEMLLMVRPFDCIQIH